MHYTCVCGDSLVTKSVILPGAQKYNDNKWLCDWFVYLPHYTFIMLEITPIYIKKNLL